ncbi:uncharacterized protein A1O9_03803 [Exophiala aquamarina CBS 119918]|uniref:4-coumarate-CoA ligase n=1 Tax=Exophiala aquamarina CBS 119918 TaxID=1182545 RepID=A0A072PTU7_9EURO|nr:uncharacterized protein A1O9_03803 [Exophiala aquamarina CBS 119918]KEF58960.1 hypothetical protein A1O9_03803 [Exophiala aquamarina CBS 119918]
MPFLAERTFPIPNKDILSWIFDEQKFDVDKPIYVDAANPSRSISSRQARKLIRQLIAGFRANGAKPGDCICIHSFNDIYYPILFLAIVGAGCVFAGTNPSYTQYELDHHFKTACVGFVITEPEMISTVSAGAKATGIPKSNIWSFNTTPNQAPLPGFKSWTTLLEYGEEDWVRFDDEKTSRATTAARLFSSGTTGLPKAAALSHYNFVAQHTLAHEVEPAPYKIIRICYLPMFHAAMVPLTHVSPLHAEYVTYVMRRFDLVPLLDNIDRYKITELLFVPAIVLAVIKYPGVGKYSFKSLESVASGAAPLSKEHQLDLQAIVGPQIGVTQGWGMTETCCIASRFLPSERDETGSIGRMLPNLDVKLIDDEDKDITAYDTTGELCIRGPTIITDYFNNPEATATSFTPDGYFKTGDVMYCTSDTKKWYIIDRRKELIKVRGFQVAPGELEGVLLLHPQILEAAVIGIRNAGDSDNLEHPRAYVVRRPGPEGEALDEATIKAFCSARLAKFKELTGGVRFLDVMPRNATGKLLKRVLRELAKEEDRGKAARI